jgi:hypothetical protein
LPLLEHVICLDRFSLFGLFFLPFLFALFSFGLFYEELGYTGCVTVSSSGIGLGAVLDWLTGLFVSTG